MVAMSAGNHAQGVAYHGLRLGIPAVIVMPRHRSAVKVERTRGFGAEKQPPAPRHRPVRLVIPNNQPSKYG